MMGGRGGSGGGYSSIPVSSLERMLEAQEAKMRQARFAHSTIKSDTSPVIARKIRADTKKYDAAFQEAKKIESALKVARKKKRAVPF